MKNTLMIILTGIIISVATFGMYVNSKITTSAGTILNDRLIPVPLLSHRFDYYGTTINNAIQTSIPNIDTFLSKKEEILQVREETKKMWEEYKATYLVSEEDSVCKLADAEMIQTDKTIDEIYANTNNKSFCDSTLKQLKYKIPSITEKCNFLLDLQLRVGQEETKKMLNLVKVFGNFMIGAIAIAIMLLGSIIYSKIRERKENKQQTKKTTKKTTKKPIKKAKAKR
jgi:hypothetical protein